MFRRLLYFGDEKLLIPEHVMWGNIVITFLLQSASQMAGIRVRCGTMVKIKLKKNQYYPRGKV